MSSMIFSVYENQSVMIITVQFIWVFLFFLSRYIVNKSKEKNKTEYKSLEERGTGGSGEFSPFTKFEKYSSI